jgi:sporulation protein YlmC with PRC-barrel domain
MDERDRMTDGAADERERATGGTRTDNLGAVDDREASIGPEGYPEGTRLPSLRRLKGMEVCDESGERVGRVSDIFLDSSAEHVRYVAVKTGRMGSSTGLVPIDDVSYTDDGEGDPYLTVPYSKEALREAPSVGDKEDLTPDREREVYEHYRRVGYWDTARDVIRSRQTVPAPTPEIARAEVVDALNRGQDPERVRVRRWGV